MCVVQIFELQSGSNGASNVEWSKELTIGSYVDGEIQDVKDYGVIVNIYKHKDIVGFLSKYQCKFTCLSKITSIFSIFLDIPVIDGLFPWRCPCVLILITELPWILGLSFRTALCM